jgi:hypothetical protein
VIRRKDLLEHPAVNAWQGLKPETVEPQRIEVVEESSPGRIVLRLIGVGKTGSDVIAKRTPQSTALVERTIYEEILPKLPLPMLLYYGSIFEQNSGYCWLFLEDVSGERYHPHIIEHRVAAAKWLGTMNTTVLNHSAASRLPNRGPDHYLMLLQGGRDTILSNISNPALEPAGLPLLEAVVAHCDYLSVNWKQFTIVCEEMPKTLVHGDFITKNIGVRTTEDGITLLPFDWEKAGWGNPAEDISRVDIPTYWDTVKEFWPELDLQAFERLANVGRVFRCLVYLDWISPQLGGKAIEQPMHHLSQCETWLSDLIQTLPKRN